MSTAQRLKLSKKLFLSLKPGQYIMDNHTPLGGMKKLGAVKRINGNTGETKIVVQ